MQTDEEYFAEFERMGEAVVDAKIKSGFAGKRLTKASAWKALKDQEREDRKEASNSESLALAREANKLAEDANVLAREASTAANTANKIAIAAAIVAAISAIIVVFPKWF